MAEMERLSAVEVEERIAEFLEELDLEVVLEMQPLAKDGRFKDGRMYRMKISSLTEDPVLFWG